MIAAAVLRRRPDFVMAVPWLVLGALLASAVITIVAHRGDLTGLNHVSGVWLGLAQQAHEGRLPPPVADDGYYGGTRYMPLPIAVLAGVGGVVGDIAAGRLLALIGICGLLAVVAVVLRRAALPLPFVGVSLLLLLATSEGYVAALTIRFDAAPVALQLGAVAILASTAPSKRAIFVAGGLAGAAPCIKSTALWALLVGVLLLAKRRDLTRLAHLLAGTVVAVVTCFVIFLLVPDNAVLSNLRKTSVGEDSLLRPDVAVHKLAGMLSYGSTVTLLLMSAGLGVFLWAAAAQRLTVWHGAWAASSVLLLAVLPDRGVDTNHLLDLSALSLMVTALAFREPAAAWDRSAALGVMTATLAFASLGVNQSWKPIVVDALRQVAGRAAPTPHDPLAGVVPAGASILSEDPALPALRHQRPVLTDPFLFRRLSLTRPELTSGLVSRLQAHEFDAVVLLDTRPPSFYADLHLGSAVYEAILREYPVAQPIPGYVVRRPAS